MRPRDSDVLLDAVLDRGIIELDSAGTVVHWSAGAQAVFGYSEVEVLGRPVSVLHSDDDRATGAAERELAAAIESDHVEFDSWRVRKDGHQFRTGVTLRAIRDKAGTVTGFVEVVKDLTADEQRGHSMFHDLHSMFHDLLEAAPDATVIVGPDGRITLANAQTDRMFGYPRADLIGSAVEVLLPPRLRGKHVGYRTDFLADPVLRPMGDGPGLWGMRRDGTEFPVDISLSPLRIEQTLHVWAAIRDVTERHECQEQLRRQKDALIETQRKLERLAIVDTLTRLLNHAETMARLEAALTNPRAPGAHLGVLFCDADRFKAIKTTGDTRSVTLCCPPWPSASAAAYEMATRWGGSEGTRCWCCCPVCTASTRPSRSRTRSAAGLPSRPTAAAGQFQATVSIGATLALPGESVDAMTARADTAMYRAKRAGRNTVHAI